jgi:hypothetical protein
MTFGAHITTALNAGATLNVNGLGAKALYKYAGGAAIAIEAGDCPTAYHHLFMYDSDADVILVINPVNGTLTAAMQDEVEGFFGSTDITGAEAETLTQSETSNADLLHTHAIKALERVRGKMLFHINEDTAIIQSAYSASVRVLSMDMGTTGGGGSTSGSHWEDTSLQGSWTGSRSVDLWVRFATAIETAFAGIGYKASYNSLPATTAFTLRHVGFVFAGSSVYASCADGTTQTISSAIAGITITDINQYRIELDSGTTARFYINGTLKATLTTNLPTGTTDLNLATVAVRGAGETMYNTYPVVEVTPV